jgi:hypothetical protein
MGKRILMLCLAVLALGARAEPVVFNNTQVQTNAVAISGDGTPGFDGQQSADGGTIASSVDSIGSTDVATAGAFAAPGLLFTSADVSASLFGSAVATAEFTGDFTGGGLVNLYIDWLTGDVASGSGNAKTSLFITLVSDGVTLFDAYVDGPWSYSFRAADGSTNVLDILLSSEVDAAFVTPGDGNGSAFGQVAFSITVPTAGTVPETGTLLLLVMGLGVLMWTRSRRGRPLSLALAAGWRSR